MTLDRRLAPLLVWQFEVKIASYSKSDKNGSVWIQGDSKLP